MAGSFFSATTREACPRIKDSSFLSSVRSGQMTQYSAYTGGCIGISPGCPCGDLNQSMVSGGFVPALPGAVSGIIYTVGSLIVSWDTPRVGTGPFRYTVTLSKAGGGPVVETVETVNTSYRFTAVEEGAVYHATVCAKNDFGVGPVAGAEKTVVAPPAALSEILEGGGGGGRCRWPLYRLSAGVWPRRCLCVGESARFGADAGISSTLPLGGLCGASVELGYCGAVRNRCSGRLGMERGQVLQGGFRCP